MKVMSWNFTRFQPKNSTVDWGDVVVSIRRQVVTKSRCSPQRPHQRRRLLYFPKISAWSMQIQLQRSLRPLDALAVVYALTM